MTIPYTLLDCSSISTAPFIVPTGWGLILNNRPLTRIRTWYGSYANNPLGLDSSWYDNDLLDFHAAANAFNID